MLIKAFTLMIDDVEIRAIVLFLRQYDVTSDNVTLDNALYFEHLEIYQNSIDSDIIYVLSHINILIKSSEIKINQYTFKDFTERAFRYILFYLEYGDFYDELFDVNFNKVEVELKRIPEKCGYEAYIKFNEEIS